VNGRELPDATDYWDANWLVCTAEIIAGAFSGHLDCSLRADELERFHQQVEHLNQRLESEAELTTMEGWLTLRLTGDGRGHVAANCHLCDDPVDGNTLNCHLAMDQTILPPLLRQLAKVLETYPVIHRRG
jgi:hypothetical protein